MASNSMGLAFDEKALHLSLLKDGQIVIQPQSPLPEGLILAGQVTDPDRMVRLLRELMQTYRLPNCPCTLVLPRDPAALQQPSLTHYQAIFRRAGLRLCRAISEERALEQILARDFSDDSIGILDRRESPPRIHFFPEGHYAASKELENAGEDLPGAIRRAVNFYNLSIPVDAAPVTKLVCGEPLPGEIPGIPILPLTSWGSMLAEGGALSGFDPENTLDLIQREPGFRPWAVFLPAAVFCVALLLFVNLGILKPLETRAQLSDTLAARQEQLSLAADRLSRFDQLEQDYLRWGRDQLKAGERDLVSRTGVLNLIRDQIAPHARISDLTLNDNALTMHLSAITLESASILMDALEADPLVSRAGVVSAAAEDGKQARILISITLIREE